MRSQVIHIPLINGFTFKENISRFNREEARDKIGDCTFTRSNIAHDRQGFAVMYCKGDIFQRRGLSIVVTEGNVAEF